jgi:hypothetical protein
MNNTQTWRRLALTHLHRYRTNYISDFNDMHEAITGSGVADCETRCIARQRDIVPALSDVALLFPSRCQANTARSEGSNF